MKHKSLMPMNLQYFAEGDDQKFSFDDFKSLWNPMKKLKIYSVTISKCCRQTIGSLETK